VKNEIEIQLAQVYKRLFNLKLMVTVKKGDKSIEFEAEKEDRITHSQTDE
jgi:GTP-binding protein Era